MNKHERRSESIKGTLVALLSIGAIESLLTKNRVVNITADPHFSEGTLSPSNDDQGFGSLKNSLGYGEKSLLFLNLTKKEVQELLDFEVSCAVKPEIVVEMNIVTGTINSIESWYYCPE